MKTRQTPVKPATHTTPTKTAAADSRPCLPNAACLSALRAWYEGMHSRDAVMRYLNDRIAPGQSARGVLGGLRRQLIDLARARHRNDLAAVFEHPERERARHARAVVRAIDVLHETPVAVPLIGDDVDLWLSPRAAGALRAQGSRRLRH